MCKKLPSDAADFVMEAVPLLTNLLQYHDAKVRKLYLSNTMNLVTPDPILTPILHPKLLSFSVSLPVGFRACLYLLDTNCRGVCLII